MNDIPAEHMGYAVAENDDEGKRHKRSEPRRGLPAGADERQSDGYAKTTEHSANAEHRKGAETPANELSDRHLGMRLLRVAVVAICYFVIEVVAKIVTVAQFAFLAWRKQPHPGMQRLGESLSAYMYAMWRYCTFASDDAPWPFKPWPRGQADIQH